jgi:hypothetical protein
MRVLQPLESVVTADGELKRGKVEMDGQPLRVDCAADNSWVSLHDESLGDPLAYDVLIAESGTLRADQPTLTSAWTPEQFAWLLGYIDPPPPEPLPEPMLFIRRPAQGFVPPTGEDAAPTPLPIMPQAKVNDGTRYLYYGLIYLVLGLICWNTEYSLVRLMGGFFLLTAMRMLYEGRVLAKQICLLIYGKIKQRL